MFLYDNIERDEHDVIVMNRLLPNVCCDRIEKMCDIQHKFF